MLYEKIITLFYLEKNLSTNEIHFDHEIKKCCILQHSKKNNILTEYLTKYILIDESI